MAGTVEISDRMGRTKDFDGIVVGSNGMVKIPIRSSVLQARVLGFLDEKGMYYRNITNVDVDR